jgi:hypothetical protein
VLDEKLGEEVVARRRLEKKLSEANATLHKESSEHNTLRTAVGLVLNDFEVPSEPGTSSLAVQVANVTDRARGMAKRALHLGVQRSFAIARSHYKNIDLQAMSQGFTPGYDDTELVQIEEEVAPSRRFWMQAWKKISCLSS